MSSKRGMYAWVLGAVLGVAAATGACMTDAPPPSTSTDTEEVGQCPACPIVAEMRARGEAVPLACSCPGDCGDGVCSGSENSSNCPTDCGPSGPVCGNGVCESGESTSSCPADCHTTTPPSGPSCGNGVCEGREKLTCPSDCPCPTAFASEANVGIPQCPQLP